MMTGGKIINAPSKYLDDKEVGMLRYTSENRATWYYFLVKEGLDNGLALDFAYEALKESGQYLARTRYAHCKTLKEFSEVFMTDMICRAFEGEAKKSANDEFVAEIHYCPLVAAWKSQTNDEQRIATLCDVCVEMERATAKELGWKLELQTAIAKGDRICTLSFRT
jgi:hypothetical protein